MSLSTYTDLKNGILDWAARLSDQSAIARVPDFIMLAEKAMGIRRLRVLEQLVDVVGYVGPDNRTISFPEDPFTEVWQAVPTGSWTGTIEAPVVTTYDGKPLERLSTVLLLSQHPSDQGVPQYFCDTPTADGWRFWPLGPYQITVTVWGKVIPLSDSNQENVILTHYPHLYLYGALAELERYLKIPPAESQGWGADFSSALDAANKATNALMYSGSTLRTRSPR